MEKEPNLPGKEKKKWERLSEGPSAEEMAMFAAEQIEIEDNNETDRVLTPQEIAKFAVEFRQREIEWAHKDAERQAIELGDLNRQFVAFRKRCQKEGRTISDKEFSIWEQREYAESWQRLREYMNKCRVVTDEEEAEIEQPMFFTYSESELHESIEAQAGNYYRERAHALRDTIIASNSPTKEADENRLLSFYTYVNRHLNYRYMTPLEIRLDYNDDPGGYDRDRTFAHNNLILELNALNDLAKKYGTTPFTPRNFWTSAKRDQTAAVARRMRYDRDVVAEYCAVAFSEEVARRDRKLQREMRGY